MADEGKQTTHIYIPVKSQIFPEVHHLIDIDLACYEIIDYQELERKSVLNRSMLNPIQPEEENIPTVQEEWWCCNLSFTGYVDIAEHVDSTHFLPTSESTPTQCTSCIERFIIRNRAIIHFVFTHVRYQFRCTSYNLTYQYFSGFIHHLEYCLSRE